MDRQQMEHCLAQVGAYRASGQKTRVWAEANGVPAGTLQSWCAHAKRWQAQLDGVSAQPARAARSSGFVSAGVAPSVASTSVRIELNVGGTRLDLHWPVAQTRELAALLRELGR